MMISSDNGRHFISLITGRFRVLNHSGQLEFVLFVEANLLL